MNTEDLLKIVNANEKIKKIDTMLEDLPRVTTLRRVWDVAERAGLTNLVDVQTVKDKLQKAAEYERYELKQMIENYGK